MKLEAKFEFARVNPFVPVGTKGKPPTWALIPATLLRTMKRELKSKMPPVPVNGGIVVCTIVDVEHGTVMGIGNAICSLSDPFNPIAGKNLAQRRAKAEVENAAGIVGKRLAKALGELKDFTLTRYG